MYSGNFPVQKEEMYCRSIDTLIGEFCLPYGGYGTQITFDRVGCMRLSAGPKCKSIPLFGENVNVC